MASGDITPTTPRQDAVLQFRRLVVDVSGKNTATATFVDSLGGEHICVVQNGNSDGFNYATGAVQTVSTPTGFTDLMTALGLNNAKKTAAVNQLITAGIITVTGTVA